MDTIKDPLSEYPPMMSVHQVAEFLGVSVDRANAWRRLRRGPVHVKIEGTVRYPREELRRYVAANTVTRVGS